MVPSFCRGIVLYKLLYLPLKFRLFILKLRGAKGFEDTIFPPERNKTEIQPGNTEEKIQAHIHLFDICKSMQTKKNKSVWGQRSSMTCWHRCFRVTLTQSPFFFKRKQLWSLLQVRTAPNVMILIAIWIAIKIISSRNNRNRNSSAHAKQLIWFN